MEIKVSIKNKKDTPEMHFDPYANRVMSLNDFTNKKVKQISNKKHRNENAEYIQKSIY